MSLPKSSARQEFKYTQTTMANQHMLNFTDGKFIFVNMWKTYLQFIIIIEQERDDILKPSTLYCRHLWKSFSSNSLVQIEDYLSSKL